jgi:hypothetical protein
LHYEEISGITAAHIYDAFPAFIAISRHFQRHSQPESPYYYAFFAAAPCRHSAIVFRRRLSFDRDAAASFRRIVFAPRFVTTFSLATPPLSPPPDTPPLLI